MATFDEIFQNYVDYGFTKPTTPVSTVQGIGSLTNPMTTQPISGVGSSETTTTSPTTTGKGIGSLSFSDLGRLGQIAMMAISPLTTTLGLAVEGITGKTPMQMVMDAVKSITGGGYGGRSSGYGVDSVAGMASGPTHGVDSVNSQSVGADASAGGAAGAAAASAAGANDGPGTGGSFAKGGRVGFAEGTNSQSTDATEKPLTEYEQYVLRTQGVPVSEEVFNAQKQLAPSGNIGDYGYTSDLEFQKAVNELADQMISPEDALTPEVPKNISQTLFPQGDFLNIRETATSPTEYNILATKDLVENLPAVIQPFAPAAAGVMSLPYDAIQAYQRMQPGSGLSGFAKAYAAERPLRSAFERFVGASGPLAENINKAVSSLNPFQQQQYMQYATQNPEQAKTAAQRNQEFIQATQRENQATGGRAGYLQGGIVSLYG